LSLTFHKPKKDRCSACCRFDNLPADKKAEEFEIHAAHLNRAKRAREVNKMIKEN
jgi:hypothetical protein